MSRLSQSNYLLPLCGSRRRQEIPPQDHESSIGQDADSPKTQQAYSQANDGTVNTRNNEIRGIMKVSWFSAGVSSAVATKMAIGNMGLDKVIYIHVDDQHPDSMRFVKDCEEWFGQEVEIMQSPFKNVRDACMMHGKGYINGPHGANCTRHLKKMVRIKWEYELPIDTNLIYVWGMDSGEASRAERLTKSMTDQQHIFPLVELGISKAHAHRILKASGIPRPEMYNLGYPNNNCKGCVKGGMGYWNHIRVDFPDVFADRAKMEREVGHTCIKGVFLDELDPDRGRFAPIIIDDCGIFCELEAL